MTLHKRASAEWEVREYQSGEVLEVTSPEFRFGVDELFSGIDWIASSILALALDVLLLKRYASRNRRR